VNPNAETFCHKAKTKYLVRNAPIIVCQTFSLIVTQKMQQEKCEKILRVGEYD